MFKIIKKTKYVFSIELLNADPENEILLKSLINSKIMGAGTTITTSFDKINFNATHVCTLEDLERKEKKLKYNEVNELLHSLSVQINYLEKFGYTFFNFSLDKIIVITKNKQKIFININTKHMLPIKNNLITFLSPFSQKDKFLAPEIKKLCEIPSKLHYKCIYHSLGALASYCLFDDYNKLDQIKYTKVYWSILQCMNEDCERRNIILNIDFF